MIKRKMKKSLVIILSFLIISNLFSDTTKKTGWEQDGLKGKVKERTVIQYTVTNNSGEDVKKIKSKSIYKYDDKGNSVELIQDSEGITSPDVHEEKGDMVQNGEPPTFVADETLKSKKEKSSKYIKRYDNVGNEETENYVNGELRLKAKVVKSRVGSEDKKFYAVYSVIKLVEETNYNANGDLTSKSIYKYDDKGNEIEYAVYDGKGKLTGITETSYTYY